MDRHRVTQACFYGHCYTCIKTLIESVILSSTILEKLGVLLEFWKIRCWIHILAWIDRSCIVIHKSLVLDYAVFADRFRFQLNMFGIGVLIGLSRIIYAHIAYEIDGGKIITAFCRISIVCMIWYGWIQSYAMFKQQDVRWCGYEDRFRYQLTMFEVCILRGLSRLLDTHIAYEIAI